MSEFGVPSLKKENVLHSIDIGWDGFQDDYKELLSLNSGLVEALQEQFVEKLKLQVESAFDQQESLLITDAQVICLEIDNVLSNLRSLLVDYVDEDVWDGVLNVVKELRRLGAVVEFVEPPIKQLGKSPGKIAVNLIAVEYAEYGRKVREYRGGKFEKYAVPF